MVFGGVKVGKARRVDVASRGRSTVRRLLLPAVLVSALWCLCAPGVAGALPTVVSLSFDDGRVSQYDVRSVLSSHGMQATFYVNTNSLATTPDGDHLTWQQVADLAADGNEIGGHTLDHVDLTTV